MNSTGKMIHDRNITRWLFTTFVSSAAVGRHSHVELAWAGRAEYQEELNPCSSHSSMQTPVRADNHCRWQGRTLQLRCSSSRRSWLRLTERVRVQPLLVSIPGLQKVHIFSVTVILASRRGSSSMIFYTYIFWTPTESY